MISQRTHNYEYAPGLTTYGIDGKTGETGKPGNSLFYTSYNIHDDTIEMMKFITKIQNQQLPVHNSEERTSRPYQNNDYFFDNAGNIYCLKDIDAINSTKSKAQVYTHYLKLCGKIVTNNEDSFAVINHDGRMVLNQKYTGLDIINNKNNFQFDTETPYVLRIMSDNAIDNEIKFLQFNAIYGVNSNTQLEIYYDTALNAYHIKSQKPILFDADVKVAKNNINSVYDGYSSVLLNETPVTSFYNLVKNFEIIFTISDEDNGKLTENGIDFNYNKLNSESADRLYNQIKDNIKIKIVYNIVIDENTSEDINNIVKKYNNGVYTFIKPISQLNDFLEQEILQYADIDIISVSYIHNIEVYGKAYKKVEYDSNLIEI